MLDHGRVAAAGRLEDWRRGGDRIYEVRIKGDQAAFAEALKVAGLESDASDGELMRVVITDGSPQQVFVVARRLGVEVRHLRPRVPSLEDLFAERVTNGRR